MTFQDKVVWITGASSGLGKYLALEFAGKGARIALSGRRIQQLEEVQTAIRALGADSMVFPCDVTDENALEKTVSEIVANYGRLDVAVANAGFGVVGKIEQVTATEWRRQLEVNVVGLAMTSRFALPYLKKTAGRLVLIGSVAAYLPNPQVGAYGVSKAAVRSIGQTLHVELKGSGVSCTLIHPGFVESDIARVDNEGKLNPEAKDPRPKNLMWPTDKAAKVMVRAIAKRKVSFVFTGHGRIMAFIGQHFPKLAVWMMGKMTP